MRFECPAISLASISACPADSTLLFKPRTVRNGNNKRWWKEILVSCATSRVRLWRGVACHSDEEQLNCWDKIVEEEQPKEDNDFEKSVVVNIEKIEPNARRISATVSVSAPLGIVWALLTDYEKLADYFPNLAECQILERRDNGARLYQVGQQKLGLGLKFKAKGIIDVHEEPVETLSNGIRRNISFKMIEGDFHVFQGRWSIMQVLLKETEVRYVVDVEPKWGLPVRLVEGRLRAQIHSNLQSICKHVMNVQPSSH